MRDALLTVWRTLAVVLMFVGPVYFVVQMLDRTGIDDGAVALLGVGFAGLWLLSLMKLEEQLRRQG